MEKILRAFVQILARLIETILKLFQKKQTAISVEVKKNVPSNVDITRLQSIMTRLEKQACQDILSTLPRLTQKKLLYVTGSEIRLWNELEKKGAQEIVDFDLSASFKNVKLDFELPQNLHRVKGQLRQVPFARDSFDCVVFFTYSIYPEDPSIYLDSLVRTLKEEGRFLWALPHPCIERELHPQKLWVQRIDRYFQALKKVGVYLEEIKEVFNQDESWKELNQIPLLLIMKGIKIEASNH